MASASRASLTPHEIAFVRLQTKPSQPILRWRVEDELPFNRLTGIRFTLILHDQRISRHPDHRLLPKRYTVSGKLGEQPVSCESGDQDLPIVAELMFEDESVPARRLLAFEELHPSSLEQRSIELLRCGGLPDGCSGDNNEIDSSQHEMTDSATARDEPGSYPRGGCKRGPLSGCQIIRELGKSVRIGLGREPIALKRLNFASSRFDNTAPENNNRSKGDRACPCLITR
jgi:hypothetical protein